MKSLWYSGITIDSNISKASFFIMSSRAQAVHFHTSVLWWAWVVFAWLASTSHPLITVLWFVLDTREGDVMWGTVWAGSGQDHTARQAEGTASEPQWRGLAPAFCHTWNFLMMCAKYLFLCKSVWVVLLLMSKGVVTDTDTDSKAKPLWGPT